MESILLQPQLQWARNDRPVRKPAVATTFPPNLRQPITALADVVLCSNGATVSGAWPVELTQQRS